MTLARIKPAIVDCGRKLEKGKHFSNSCHYYLSTRRNGRAHEKEKNAMDFCISRDDLTELKLQNERVCNPYFVSGKPAQSWDTFNFDWVPTLIFGHMKNGPDYQLGPDSV